MPSPHLWQVVLVDTEGEMLKEFELCVGSKVVCIDLQLKQLVSSSW